MSIYEKKKIHIAFSDVNSVSRNLHDESAYAEFLFKDLSRLFSPSVAQRSSIRMCLDFCQWMVQKDDKKKYALSK